MAAPSTETEGNGKIAAEEIKPKPDPIASDEENEPEEEAEPEEEEEEEGEGEEAEEEGEEEDEKADGAGAGGAPAAEIKKWPGWPGDNVYRMIVPVVKVGGIIGKKGELIKKICEETRAKVRVLDGVMGTTDRIVLIYGKEEPEAELSPAMDAVLRVFKRVNGVSDTGAVEAQASSTPAACSVRLLVPASQAINLIGKQGSSIKSIQENSGATIRVITGDELPYYATAEERVVDIQGEPSKVLKALEAVVGHLRKFLVDHSVLPLFEKTPNTPPAPAQVQAQERTADPWSDKAQSLIHAAQPSSLGSDYSVPPKRDSMFLEREPPLDSHIHRPGLSSLYRQEPSLPGARSSGLGRGIGALVTQVTQQMKIPLVYAEDIIGVGGANIAYIRRNSGAVLTVQESGGLQDEIVVEIKGSSSQVQTAQNLIQDFISGHKEPPISSYGGLDTGGRSSYSHLESSGYSSSSLTSQYGGYGSGLGGGYDSGLGGYGGYRF